MVRKKFNEDNMTATATKSYSELFTKIESLQGLDRKNFTRTLTLEEKKAYVQHLKEKNCEMITGIFRCFEPVGGSLEMDGMAFDGETPQKYIFEDGKQYTIPKYLVKRFESDFQGVGTWYPTHTNILDANGKPTVAIGKKNRRFGFSAMVI